jgi:hypothetical protein
MIKKLTKRGEDINTKYQIKIYLKLKRYYLMFKFHYSYMKFKILYGIIYGIKPP